jgi:hypothetical protein
MLTLYPTGYQDDYRSMLELRAQYEPAMHPAFARRVFPWIGSCKGFVGIGSGVRDSQPDLPGFAPAGRSFHLRQRFASGRLAYAALDLVVIDGPDAGNAHDAPAWSHVPIQGSAEAARWGVHCNIGKPGDPWPKGESWHMQPVELDGFDTWLAQGRPDPAMTYPIPTVEVPPVSATPYDMPLAPALEAFAVNAAWCACHPGNGSQGALWDVVLPHMMGGFRLPAGHALRTEFEQAARFPGGGRLDRAWDAILAAWLDWSR